MSNRFDVSAARSIVNCDFLWRHQFWLTHWLDQKLMNVLSAYLGCGIFHFFRVVAHLVRMKKKRRVSEASRKSLLCVDVLPVRGWVPVGFLYQTFSRGKRRPLYPG